MAGTDDPNMSVRFQADADLNHIIVEATLRREPSIDFQTVHVAGLVGVPDPNVWMTSPQVVLSLRP
jgi:hypothetical protein